MACDVRIFYRHRNTGDLYIARSDVVAVASGAFATSAHAESEVSIFYRRRHTSYLYIDRDNVVDVGAGGGPRKEPMRGSMFVFLLPSP